jgi:hypothetical protein
MVPLRIPASRPNTRCGIDVTYRVWTKRWLANAKNDEAVSKHRATSPTPKRKRVRHPPHRPGTCFRKQR